VALLDARFTTQVLWIACQPLSVALVKKRGMFSVISLFYRLYIEIVQMHDLTGFQRDLLYTIAGTDEPHGLALKESLEQYYEKEIHHGRLYPNLDTLVDKGLVEKGQKDRRTNVYTLTRRGQREIEARHEWEQQYVEA
jgi:PadR family transcriptional regulator PadR